MRNLTTTTTTTTTKSPLLQISTLAKTKYDDNVSTSSKENPDGEELDDSSLALHDSGCYTTQLCG